MIFKFDERWDAAGWVPCVASVQRHRVGREDWQGRKHPLAPGLVVHASLDHSGRLTITHDASGLHAGLLSWNTWTPCPEALRDALAEACRSIDFATLTAETAPYVDPTSRERALASVRVMYGHFCDVCAPEHADALAEEIQEAEEALEEAEREVRSCEDALADAENEVQAIHKQLRELRSKQAARELARKQREQNA